MNPKLIIEQKITAFANKYKIFAVDPSGNKTQLVAMAQQKRLAFKERVTFYSDEKKTTELFSFRAEKVMDIHGRYFVEDATKNLLGGFQKDFRKSFANSTWNILDAQGERTMVVKENNATLAILRRYVGFIPVIGGLFDFVMVFFRYHFVFQIGGTENTIGTYKKTTLLRDHYLLSLDETNLQTDWRVLASIAVALDALQSR